MEPPHILLKYIITDIARSPNGMSAVLESFLLSTLSLMLSALFVPIFSVWLFGMCVYKLLFAESHQAFHPKRILITGGSSGIGLQLAKDYITYGAEVLVLTATRQALLDSASQELQTFHQSLLTNKKYKISPSLTVITHPVDVSDEAAMNKLMLDMDDQFQLDCVVANAGIDADRMLAFGTPQTEIYKRVTQVNVNGVLNTVQPIVDRFKQRSATPAISYGDSKSIPPRCPTQIVIISSVAGQFPLLHGSYAASKAWATMYARCLRADLTQHNISVVCVCPGFVKTPLLDYITDNTDELLFIVGVEELTKEIIAATSKDVGQLIFSRKCYLITQAERILGCNFYDFALRRIQFLPTPKTKVE